MVKVYEFLADGFEEIEALAPVDILRRGGVEVVTVSIMGREWVESSHGISVKADALFEELDFSDADMLLLPGGMPGSTHLCDYEPLADVLLSHAARGRRIGAICAAPMVLGRLGLLKGRRATCSPGFERYLDGADYTAELFTVDGNIITGEGPAASLPYAYEILSMLTSRELAEELQVKMQFAHLMQR